MRHAWTTMQTLNDRASIKQTTTNMTSGQTYKYNQIGLLRLTYSTRQQPNAQNILKFFDSPQTTHLKNAQTDPLLKLAKEPIVANALKTTVFKIKAEIKPF